MNFKEMIQSDMNSVFFNTNEFASIHTIEGKEIAVVIDNDLLLERKIKESTKNVEGVYRGDLLFYVQKEALGDRPVIGRPMRFDGKIYKVSDCQEDEATYIITLEANRS